MEVTDGEARWDGPLMECGSAELPNHCPNSNWDRDSDGAIAIFQWARNRSGRRLDDGKVMDFKNLLRFLHRITILLSLVVIGAILADYHPWEGAGFIIVGGLIFWTVLWVQWFRSGNGRKLQVPRDKWKDL